MAQRDTDLGVETLPIADNEIPDNSRLSQDIWDAVETRMHGGSNSTFKKAMKKFGVRDYRDVVHICKGMNYGNNAILGYIFITEVATLPFGVRNAELFLIANKRLEDCGEPPSFNSSAVQSLFYEQKSHQSIRQNRVPDSRSLCEELFGPAFTGHHGTGKLKSSELGRLIFNNENAVYVRILLEGLEHEEKILSMFTWFPKHNNEFVSAYVLERKIGISVTSQRRLKRFLVKNGAGQYRLATQKDSTDERNPKLLALEIAKVFCKSKGKAWKSFKNSGFWKQF
ncbi:MAG: hypothetical protein ABIG20_00100 [archaeon]